MTVYEQLLQEAYDNGVAVRDFKLNAHDGLYCAHCIYMSDALQTTAEKTCILAEELGHFYTVAGNILNQDIVWNRQQELNGRRYAFKRLVPLSALIGAYHSYIQNSTELAEYLEITEEFLWEALAYYRRSYGPYTRYNDHIITFDPLNVYSENDLRALA